MKFDSWTDEQLKSILLFPHHPLPLSFFSYQRRTRSAGISSAGRADWGNYLTSVKEQGG